MQYELKVLSFYGDMELNDWSTMFLFLADFPEFEYIS